VSRHKLDEELSTSDVARELDVTPGGVQWFARKGKLPFRRLRSGQYIFKLSDVRRLAAKRAASVGRKRRIGNEPDAAA